jgi:hypothetical protein
MNTLVNRNATQTVNNTRLRLERRAKPRVSVPFQTTVRGTDKAGTVFEATTVLDNLSPGGLYLRLLNGVGIGSRLLVNVRMDRVEEDPEDDGFVLEVYALVRRVDRLPDGVFGVALSFASSVLL